VFLLTFPFSFSPHHQPATIPPSSLFLIFRAIFMLIYDCKWKQQQIEMKMFLSFRVARRWNVMWACFGRKAKVTLSWAEEKFERRNPSREAICRRLRGEIWLGVRLQAPPASHLLCRVIDSWFMRKKIFCLPLDRVSWAFCHVISALFVETSNI
jgi:hypothetical protein